MAAISSDHRLSFHTGKASTTHGAIVEEIDGLLRVYKDGFVERPPIIPSTSCSSSQDHIVVSRDVLIEKSTNLWARVYVPNTGDRKLPLLVYFHGGGFCVGSAAWSCYHEFLANLASTAGCIILSINYRLAPENRLPAAYDDGMNTIMWLNQQAGHGSPDHKWWLSRCDFSCLFLAGDSAGANIAYNVATRILPSTNLRGIILIQPFFGGEAWTPSEKTSIPQPFNSALTLQSADTYWRLSLPPGASRDHPYCNPLMSGASKLRSSQLPPTIVCISEMDILKDRNLEFCSAMASAGKKVETVMYKGVGHAFQVLHNSYCSRARTLEMMSHIKSFVSQQRS